MNHSNSNPSQNVTNSLLCAIMVSVVMCGKRNRGLGNARDVKTKRRERQGMREKQQRVGKCKRRENQEAEMARMREKLGIGRVKVLEELRH